MLKLKIYNEFILLLFVIAVFSSAANGQYSSIPSSSLGISIIPHVTYISSATVQLYSGSENVFERGITEELSGGYGYGITFGKKLFSDNLTFAISLDFLGIEDNEQTQTFQNDSVTVRARVTENITVIPIEFTGAFNLPNFSEDFKVFLGGGFGVYLGDRIRTVLNIQSKTLSSIPGYSLVILSGFEYKFTNKLSGVFEIKFREAQFNVKSEFPVSKININGTFYDLDKNLDSEIYVDGLKLSLGISFNF